MHWWGAEGTSALGVSGALSGLVTHRFGRGKKISIAVTLEGLPPKILDPRLVPIEALNPA